MSTRPPRYNRWCGCGLRFTGTAREISINVGKHWLEQPCTWRLWPVDTNRLRRQRQIRSAA